jgi:hypothetical protein
MTTRKSLAMPLIVFAVFGFPLVYAYAQRFITPRTLGIGFLVIMSCIFILLLNRYRSTAATGDVTEDSESRPDTARSRRRLKVIVVVLVVALFWGMWSTRGGPMTPRLIGVAANILMTSFVLFLLFKTRRMS